MEEAYQRFKNIIYEQRENTYLWFSVLCLTETQG